MLLFDLAVLMFVVYAFSFVVTYSICHFWRGVCPALTGDNVVQIVRYVAWPGSAILFVFIYRNALGRIFYASMCFIFKSHYRRDDGVGKEKEKATEEIGSEKDFNSMSKSTSESNDEDKSVETPRKLAISLLNLAARDVVLDKLQLEAPSPVLRGYSITCFNYKFDGIVELPENTYWGIKVLRKEHAEDWEPTIEGIRIAFLKWQSKNKGRFTFIACTVGMNRKEEQDKLAGMIRSLPCKATVRFCDYTGKALKEVP